MANNKTKIITKSEEDFKPKREQAQMLTFAQIQELIQRNVTKGVTKTYTTFTKETVKNYLQNPANSLSNIVEISRFLERNSSLYRKIISYYASTPLFYYNIVQDNDWSKSVNVNKITKSYNDVTKQFQGFNIAKEMYNAIYCTIRDGMYCGYSYATDTEMFFMPLNITYCRIYGKNEAGEFIVYFDASFFKSGTNSIFVEGIDGDTTGVWDDVFVQGWNDYNSDNSLRWFRLPPEKTFCMIAGTDDQFDVPLPLYANLMTDIMSLEDLADLFESKSELENYKILVSEIPLLNDSGDVDDFALSLDLATNFNAALEAVSPELVAAVTSPMKLSVLDFSDKVNSTKDSDMLSQSTQNLFNNAGVSQIVVAGGLSSNSVGLKYSILNDLGNIFVYVNRIESWLNYYIKINISDGYKIKIHKITWLNKEDYQKEMGTLASLGGSAMDLLTSHGDTPYEALQKLNFENALGIKDLMHPLQTSYTQSSTSDGGAPTKDETELTEEGLKTKEGSKNEGTKANS